MESLQNDCVRLDGLTSSAAKECLYNNQHTQKGGNAAPLAKYELGSE